MMFLDDGSLRDIGDVAAYRGEAPMIHEMPISRRDQSIGPSSLTSRWT